ncbi:MAG: hypothetical protein JNK30_11015 [Phenylobacterium sp.]|uniref:alpha/beta hydrolase family protein n=1 Tax=Phenylobacterium sp. TaxID=1871053 RepID=UPI001A4110BF|nr:hypothetical protein [Phenylobacterium sp.]MBL8771901.1 hypothetical protein [Phenylobacterium sp.]
MTHVDLALIGALVAFVLAWWLRPLPGRLAILWTLAALVVLLGLYGLIDDRWQNGVGAAVGLVFLLVLGINRLRRAPRREGWPYVSGPLFGILAAVAAASIVLFPVDPLPKPSGRHPVGVRSFELVDAARPGLISARPEELRRLLVRVWYPAGSVAGLKPRRYFSEAEADTTARTLGELVGFGPFFTYVKHVRTNSYEAAPLLAGATGLPVVFYSHGYTSFLSQNTALMEELASHGYVVVSVQHTYDSSSTVFPNGDVAPADPKLADMAQETDGPVARAQNQAIGGATLDERLEGYLALREMALSGQNDRLARSGEIWAADRIFVHDQLQRGAAPPAIREIMAAADLTRVGEMGMSFGGATAGTVCMSDRRCAAGVNLDGGDFPFAAFAADVPAPFLMFHSDVANISKRVGAAPPAQPRSFNEFSYEPFATAGRRADVYRVQLKGSQHLGLSDFSLFVRRPVRDPLFGSAPATVMVGAQNDFVRAFFDRHLRGANNRFPQPQMARYERWVTPLRVDAVRNWWAAKPAEEQAGILARIEKARAAPAP